MPRIYSIHDILLMPSVGLDALPRAILEGMSAECIVLGARVGGIPEAIEHGINGFLFEPGDSDALSDLILELFNHPDSLGLIRQAGKQTVISEFSIDRCVDEIVNYLEQQLAG